ncbi:glutathione S-transferase family protein [Aestuariibacter sp. GS-14]|uniref:glutathione S-transferase family protein n=1 Tax=Aestuariibacter sp. GS-14 TaxID=2590670 RepID=UPI00112D807A|nr:glutathione S-transferase C-terminal domain-containing protein [Aestuariibacter sp. GS-14]TPV59773.1 glutathione S-transferase family protein [Aestuariibacter sp. GS-14]
MLVNGKWDADWHPVQNKDEQGRFIRQTSSFRNWITPDGTPGPTGKGGFKAEPGRYHLYAALICPWASRVLAVLALKGLTRYISVTIVNPQLSEQGWQFGGYEGAEPDPMLHATYLHEIYSKADTGFTGRATVPVLWDKQQQTIVNNESADIVRMLNTAFSGYTQHGPNLYPAHLAKDIDQWNDVIYARLNNGVYQAGFASSQQAYNEAFDNVFSMLEQLESALDDGRKYLLGDQLTETDIRLFVTLVRFDAAYYSLFKCNKKHIRDYQYLHRYMLRIMQLDGMAGTVSINHIKAGYYSIKALNPSGIIPKGPELSL